MARKTVYIPDELLAEIERSNTDLAQSLSREFQAFLRQRLANAAPSPWQRELRSGATLRALATADIPEVLALSDDTDDGWHLTEMARRRVADNLERTVDHPDAFCLVAEREAQVVGFVTASIGTHPVMPGRTGEIEEIHVHREFRRQRIGSDLLIDAIRWFEGIGISHVRLIYANDQVKTLKPFFESLSFECDSTVATIWPR